MGGSVQSSVNADDSHHSPSGPRRVANAEVAKKDLRVLYNVIRDPQTQWYVPLLMAGVFLWAISPVDAIPDIFPILGILDETIVFLLCRAAVYRVVPQEVVSEHIQSEAAKNRRRFTLKHIVGGVIVFQLAVLILLLLVANQLFTGLL